MPLASRENEAVRPPSQPRAPDGQDALQTLKHRYLVVRHLARVTKGPRKLWILHRLLREDGLLLVANWDSSQSERFPELVWEVQPDGSLSEGTHRRAVPR